jgi:hypothetical protein
MPSGISPADYAGLFALLDGKRGRYAVFGGMAVLIWADEFLSPEEQRALIGETELFTKDLDIRGRMPVVRLVNAWADHAGPVNYAVFKWRTDDNRAWRFKKDDLVVEIMESIKGLDTGASAGTGYSHRVLVSGDRAAMVLDPVSCLIAKDDVLSREMRASLDGTRNDIRHVRLLVAVCEKYLAALDARAGKNDEARRLADRQRKRHVELQPKLTKTLEEYAKLERERRVSR